MTRLMADAGITPQIAQVRSGEAELSRITGAQKPSGVPVAAAPVKERDRRGSAFMGRGTRRGGGAPARRGRPGEPTPEARAAAAQRRANRAA